MTDYLDTPETMAFYLQDALETGDAGELADAIQVVARARARWLADDKDALASLLPLDVEWGELRKYQEALLGLGLTLSVRPVAA